MAKNTFMFVAVIVVGALIGSFLGKFIGIVSPAGSSLRSLFATDISAGLSPATLDLRIIELTFGCLLKFNVTAIIGIVIAALLFKVLAK